ncbi:MAG TPA: glycosyltransferase family 4 protein [Longilinea sp.]|nr:glycosyltransferase family 4 protein [Longilinea sp.]
MKYKVVFYCPDRHVPYDAGRLPDTTGVGGGVMARIRMAQALAAEGHSVTLICNCQKEETERGVRFIPLEGIRSIQADILVITTSGDGMNLAPLSGISISAQRKILMVHGLPRPQGFEGLDLDWIYPLSNYIRKIIQSEWEVPTRTDLFVTYRGVKREYFHTFLSLRNPFRLAYVGNPLKGRQNAFHVLEKLRKIDPRYHLHVFGDERLWNGTVEKLDAPPGVTNFGLLNQRQLARKLLGCSYSLVLQRRQEPFGNSLVESMAAGCIPLASPVGAYNELVVNGKNGYLIEGDAETPEAWDNAVERIRYLQTHRTEREAIRKSAAAWPFDWSDMAVTWGQHWDLILGLENNDLPITSEACPECSQPLRKFHDGLHCLQCGGYIKGRSG